MRNLFPTLLVLFILCTTSFCLSAKASAAPPINETIVIGQITGGAPLFVVSSTTLMNDLQNFIAINQQTAVSFNQIDIVFYPTTSQYFLVAKGTTQNGDLIKTTIHVRQTVECLYIGGEPTVTCTTKDCASETAGCIPASTACTSCANNGTCTKTVSGSPRVIFTSFPPSSCQ